VTIYVFLSIVSFCDLLIFLSLTAVSLSVITTYSLTLVECETSLASV